MDKDIAKKNLKVVLDKYNKFKDSDALKVEANAEKIIEDIFEKVLGWESLEDYIKRKSQETGKFPDYTFRLNGINKFFLEAKKLDANLDTLAFQKQAVGYARSSAVPFGILTNFREIRVYVVDREIDNIKSFDKIQLFTPILIERCLEDNEFDKLWMFSKESFQNRKIYEFAEEICKLPKRKDIDEQLSIKLNSLREKIKTNIKKHEKKNEMVLSNTNAKLLIEEVTQRILDRMVFIRVCEDREYEDKHLERFFNAYEQSSSFKVWEAIKGLFRDYDKKNEKTGVGGYNSGLFEISLCDSLFLDDEVLAKTIKEFYYFEDVTPINFSKIPADILGNLYENYLAHISRNVDTQKSHRKEHGIFYTPTYIVDYIVQSTIGEMLKNKKLDIEKIKVLDPACGSGSFLIKTFDLIEEHYKNNRDYNQKTLADDGTTYSTKEKILKNNIFGVDLDNKAVEISQLNLLLRIAEKGHKLPILRKNIKNGNSLIDDENIAPKDYFKWDGDFQEGSFDVVIGNPPYVRQEELTQIKPALEKYKIYNGQNDLYAYFFEKGINLLKEGGLFGFIVSSKFIKTNYGKDLRQFILDNTKIIKFIDFADLPVFSEATTYPCIIILEKSSKKEKNENNKVLISKLNNLNFLSLSKEIDKNSFYLKQSFLSALPWNMVNETQSTIKNKIDKAGIPLTEFINEKLYRGVTTGCNEAFIINEKIKDELIKKDTKSGEIIMKFLTGKDIKRYSTNFNNLYLIYTYTGIKLDNYPAIKEYLLNFKTNLNKVWEVKHGKHPWYELRGCSYYDKFKSPKIIYPRINIRPNFTFDEDKYFTQDSSFIIPSGSKYLLGVLNSKLMNYYAKQVCSLLKGGYYDYRYQYVELFPIVKPDKITEEKIVGLVNKILEANKRLNQLQNKNANETSKLEEDLTRLNNSIDQEVYGLYGVTEKKEREIIENSFCKE